MSRYFGYRQQGNEHAGFTTTVGDGGGGSGKQEVLDMEHQGK